MDEHSRILIGIRLEKCQEDLAGAELLLENGLHRAAINRAYYAVFHIASAALFTLGVSRSKHSGVQGAFAEYLIRPGHIEPEYYDVLKYARKLREESDYRDDLLELTAEETASLLADAKRFVGRLERYLAEMGIFPTSSFEGSSE